MSDVADFIKDAGHADRKASYGPGFCGPDSRFAKAVRAALTGNGNDKLLGTTQRVNVANRPTAAKDDETIPDRWAALSAVAQAALNRSRTDIGKCELAAKRSFDDVWTARQLDGGVTSAPLTETSAARSADDSLFGELNPHLAPWTAGSWMAWDAFTAANGTAPALTEEETPVLFAPIGGQGLVARLVVEVLPGPTGLATPHWWRIGLTPFPTPNGCFLRALQEVLGAVAARHTGYRLRWYLKPDPSAGATTWDDGLEGRSGMAAATCAGLAVFERLGDGKPAADPVLDDRIAVTAEVVPDPARLPRDWTLKTVEGLKEKFDAAEAAKIDTVAVAEKQDIPTDAARDGVRNPKVGTVAAALEQLRSMQQAFDRYAAWMHKQVKPAEVLPPTR